MPPPAAARPGAAVPLWERQSRQWAHLGRPLRPSDQDVALAQAVIDRRESDGGISTALLLGVTPELIDLQWPVGATVLATDRSMVMIREVGFDGGRSGRPAAVAQADWLALPLADATCDLALSDGGFANVSGAEVAALADSVRRALRPGGTLATRMFLRPDDPEDPAEVWNDLVGGRIGTFAAFKLRLLMALAAEDGDVGVADGWRYWASHGPDVNALAARLAWPPETIRTIEAYQGQPTVYWLPTLAQFRAVISRGFDEQACHWPGYELGDRCPTFVLR